jgi:hypothetical protein
VCGGDFFAGPDLPAKQVHFPKSKPVFFAGPKRTSVYFIFFFASSKTGSYFPYPTGNEAWRSKRKAF